MKTDRPMKRFVAAAVLVAAVAVGGCEGAPTAGGSTLGDGSGSGSAGAGMPGDGAAGGGPAPTGTAGAGAGPAMTSNGCADLFDQATLATYAIEISADEWAKMDAEFRDIAALQTGVDFAVYHPIVFHLGGETVADAAIKLHGQSSWLQAVMYDGDRAKMQFSISFDQTNPAGSFHGVSRLVFDMPRSDYTFLHDRLAHTWLREAGLLAPCTSSAQLTINGANYGLYALEEGVGHRVVKQFFPANPDGDLWKGGADPVTNEMTASHARLGIFRQASDLAALSPITDVAGSLTSWAAEALLNDADGYYGGGHNFYLYDQGAAGFLFLPQDTDSTFDWLAVYNGLPYADHPVYWWAARGPTAPRPGDKWMIVLGDAGQRAAYAQSIAGLLARWNVAEIQGWIDAWSQQIAAAAAGDPHLGVDKEDIKEATRRARDVVAGRPAYLQTFVDCENRVAGAATDGDGDGHAWCDECDDANAAVHPGAAEICGNGVDDDCNGVADDGC